MSGQTRRQMNMDQMLLKPIEPAVHPFENRQQLYLMHFFFAFVSRMWDMGIVLLVAQLTNNSLYLVAIIGLFCAMSIFLFMGSIGHMLDKTNRIVAVRMAMFVKITAVTVAYGVCAYLSLQQSPSATTVLDAEAANFHKILLYSLPVLSAIIGIAFCAITQSIEKDWIVVLSGKDTAWLSTTNSVMTQIDLMCSSLAPAVTGVLFANLSHTTVSIILLLINALSTAALYVFMSHLYYSWPALGQKVGVDVLYAVDDLNCADDLESFDDLASEELNETPGIYGAISDKRHSFSHPQSHTNADKKEENSRLSVRTAEEIRVQMTRRVSTDAVKINNSANSAAVTEEGTCCGSFLGICANFSGVFKDFMKSGCAGMMVAYAALYLTVLSFGSLMTVYTRWAGVTDDLIGAFRGVNALFGYAGAVMFPFLSQRWGLWQCAQVAILYQFILVATAASSFFWARDSVSVYIVMIAVLFSRTGLWLFDLCVRQIAQETIHEAVRGKVNGQWRAMTAFFEMTAYALAVYIPNPQDFWILTTISAGMIGFALVTYSLTNPTNAFLFSYLPGSGDSASRAAGYVPVDSGNCNGNGNQSSNNGRNSASSVAKSEEGYVLIPSSGNTNTTNNSTNNKNSKSGGAGGEKGRRNESLGGVELQPNTNTRK